MSEFIQTASGLLVPKPKKPTVTLVPCGYCPKQIMIEAEPRKRPHIHKGKPMCRKCCVLKLGRMGSYIQSRTPEALRDADKQIEHKRELERKRIGGLSAISNSRTLKNLDE